MGAEPYIGEIALMAGQVVPHGWLPCDGRALDVQANSALFSLITYTYGGSGQTFHLPDLRGNAIRGAQLGSGEFGLGENGGNESVSLTSREMPPHSHSLNASTSVGTTNDMTNALPAGAGTSANVPNSPLIYATGGATVALDPSTIASSGGSQSHSNMQPYLALNYFIATQGHYPSKN